MNTAETILSTLVLDTEIAEDLQILGIETPDQLDQTRRDALASRVMKRMAQETHELAQLEASLNAEIQLITARYETELVRHRTRFSELKLGAEAIAIHTLEAGGYVKKKSRDVGAGTYGYKTYAEGAELKDEAAYLAWAEANAPHTLRVKPTMSLAQAREYLTETELAGVRREIMKTDVVKLIATDPQNPPPGYQLVPATNEYFAKPLPLPAIAPAL